MNNDEFEINVYHQISASPEIMKLLSKFTNLGDRIMSAISDFAIVQNAFNDRMNVAISGLQGDVQNLKDLIKQLQDSAGKVTPQDQVLLDQMEASSKVISDKLEALDNLTPPNPPVA